MIRESLKFICEFFRTVKGKTIWIFQLFLSSILGHITSMLLPLIASNIVLYVTDGDVNAAYYSALMLGITYLFYNLIWYWNYEAYSYNFKYCYRNIQEQIIDKVFTYDEEFTKKISKAKILNTNNNDVVSLSLVIDFICEFFMVSIKMLVIIFIFLKANLFVGLAVLLLDIIYINMVNKCNILSTKYLQGQTKYSDKITDNLSQILNGLREIKLFNIQSKIKKNFRLTADKWQDQYILKRRYYNLKEALVPLIVNLGKVTLYVVLIYMTATKVIEINMLILLISYYEYLITESNNLMGYTRSFKEYNISLKRIQNILNYKAEKEIEFGLNDNDYIAGLVEFKKVDFSYKNSASIKNISFKALPNEITALVGHSGSGKSTVVNLLLRLYKIDEGKILIDGESIYEFSKEIYSNNVVAVNQSPFIFNMSIKRNLLLIEPDFEKCVEACKRVGIHDYIMTLPKGYNTVLKENASNFSGGQRQLIALARTLLSKAEVLIFDEITSSLDPMLVDHIKEILEDLKKDHTIILITHKKDVMSIADKIIVLNKGQIVGKGTHEELLKENKYYIDLQNNNYSSSNKKMYDEADNSVETLVENEKK